MRGAERSRLAAFDEEERRLALADLRAAGYAVWVLLRDQPASSWSVNVKAKPIPVLPSVVGWEPDGRAEPIAGSRQGGDEARRNSLECQSQRGLRESARTRR
jgi:hypothetical protein